MKKKRVICAMSGGVDSSVAAALLKEQGYDVIGVFMKLWAEDTPKTDLVRENICCSLEASMAARAVANKLGIPFYVVNFAEEFKKAVVDYYVSEYEKGRTPNPCVICNRDIKGEILMNKVLELNGDYLATGHYAKIVKEKGEYHLYHPVDENKDQTYFLWTLTQEKLAKLLFPLGNLTKPEVRQIASRLKLPTAQRKESQGICFIPDRDVCGFLRRHGRKLTKPGEIVDLDGKKLGYHDGLINYTVGQRERLGLGGPKAYYVLQLDSKINALVVGNPGDLYKKELIAKGLNWIGKIDMNDNIQAQIRYGHPIEDCELSKVKGGIKVEFKEAQRAITPGQSIVFYSSRAESRDKGNEILGGGIIEESI